MSVLNYRDSLAAALSSVTAVDSIAKEIGRASGWREEIERSLRPALAIQEQLQQASNSLSALAYAKDYFGTNSLSKFFEQHQRLQRAAVGPLAQLRAESIWERDWVQRLAIEQSSISLQNYTGNIISGRISSLDVVRKAYEGINATAHSIVDSLNTERRAMIEAASRPYVGLVESLVRDSASVRVLQEVADGVSWINQFKMPVIDSFSAVAVAKTWGIEGALREISLLGLDAHTMQALANSLEGIDGLEDWVSPDDAGESTGAATPSRRHSLETWLSIFSVLLAILVPIWQKIDSDATEARLTAKIEGISAQLEEGEQRSAKRFEALAQIVNRMLEQSENKATGEVGFVVRSRVALIRTDGKSGSRVVAEVFPNQVVKLIAEDGKWIEVGYFDWNAQEERSGWALKKYFLRVNGSPAVVNSVDVEHKR